MPITVPADYVYLDWAATAPLCDEAREAMEPFLAPGKSNVFLGMNANSLHSPGRAAFEALEQARRTIATCIGAGRPNEVIFTSGATEADNMAIIGLAHAAAKKRNLVPGSAKPPRVVTTRIEHDAVLSCMKRLKSEGFEIGYAPVGRDGFADLQGFEEAIDEKTVLVSVQMANSEIGAIQPVRELAQIAHRKGAFFHTDAVQALGKVMLDVQELGIDAASFAGHKIGAPKGIGALYLKARTPFEAQLLGGGQEDARRSGTQNVCGAVGFAAACVAACAQIENESTREIALRDGLYEKLVKLANVTSTVSVERGSRAYLPNIVHVLVKGYESETLILRLDDKGFGVSGGSACSSHSLEPSHVLMAIGVQKQEAYEALRISFGRLTTEEELEEFAQALEEILG